MFTELEKAHITEVKKDIRDRVNTYKEVYYPNMPWVSIFLSGGAITSIFRNEKINDFDFYFKTELSKKIGIETLVLIYNDNIKEYDPKYNTGSIQGGKLMTDNAVTMVDGAQFITCMYGQPAEIKLSFDFVHCCPHYDILSDKLYISKEQYDAIMNKKLIYRDPNKLVKTFRFQKFADRGWTLA